MTISDPYSAGAVAPLTTFGTIGAIASGYLQSPYLFIRRHGGTPPNLSPYHSPLVANERQAAIDHAIAVMDEPVEMVGEFRAFSRDEMHERP
jgi:hypothetical protein